MSDAEIEAFAARLEAEVRVEDARLMTDMRTMIENEGSGTILTANRAAFLHMAAMTLRGAIATENVMSDRLGEHLGDYNLRDFSALFDFVERRESWPDEPVKEPPTFKARINNLLWEAGCLGILVIVVILMLIGFNTVTDWISR